MFYKRICYRTSYFYRSMNLHHSKQKLHRNTHLANAPERHHPKLQCYSTWNADLMNMGFYIQLSPDTLLSKPQVCFSRYDHQRIPTVYVQWFSELTISYLIYSCYSLGYKILYWLYLGFSLHKSWTTDI